MSGRLRVVTGDNVNEAGGEPRIDVIAAGEDKVIITAYAFGRWAAFSLPPDEARGLAEAIMRAADNAERAS